MQAQPAPDPSICPLCKGANACGMAAKREDCWCFSVKLDPLALAKIPADAQGKACVCRACGMPASEPKSSGSNG